MTQTKVIKVDPNFPEVNLIKEAAEILQKGGLVAFPTETVYGIGANFLDKNAIDRLYKIKKRAKGKPFTFHIGSFDALKDWDIRLSKQAERIIKKFWPGPLTIVATDGKKNKIGIRMPNNKVALALIKEASVPIVAPSANISGSKPPVSSGEVISEMKGNIDIVLDAGITEVGRESTVLDVTTKPFKVLREGAIPKEDLMADYHVLFVCTGNSCRSVMAKAILERFLKEAGFSEKVRVDSAGISAYLGGPAALNTIQVMNEQGVDVSNHKGKSAASGLLKIADYIFVMEHSQRDLILNRLPSANLKVRLLKEDGDIPDPIGKSIDEYRRVVAIIRDQVENIFLELFKKIKG